MKRFRPQNPERIMLRATNWVGDAVMTLPALTALKQAQPQAAIEVLAKPWVADVYQSHPAVERVFVFEADGEHAAIWGKLKMIRQLRARRYDWAVLFQNAFQAGLLAFLSGAKTRIGYASDGRGPLLTHAVKRGAKTRAMHETAYYLNILFQAGLVENAPPAQGVPPELFLHPADEAWADECLAKEGLSGARLMGMAPGASFGPAKCWPEDRFAQTAVELAPDGYQALLLFGGPGEVLTAAKVAKDVQGLKVLNLAGATSLGQVMALLKRLTVFITNDSGLMHAGAALGTPTVAVFGSTNPVTTRPLGSRVTLLRKPLECSPCLKPECPRGLECFLLIEPGETAAAARRLLVGDEV